MSGESDRELAVRFMRELAVRTAHRIQKLPWGVALFNEQLRRVWDLNLVWLDTVPPRLEAGPLADELDRVQGAAGLGHRHAIVPDERGGDRLAPGLQALTWTTKRHLLMVQRRTPDRPADLSLAQEIDEPAIRAFTEASLRRDPAGYSEESIRQIAGQKHVVAAAGARFFGIELDGDLVSGCDLYGNARVAQIESVITLPEYRNRGLARAVVMRALAEARASGAELVFLQAEEDDWPKDLYRRLGFDAVGFTHDFLRPPS